MSPDPDRCLRGVGLRRQPPFPSPAPLGPQPGSSTRQPPPFTQRAYAVLLARPAAPGLHPPPCAAAAQATVCRRALARCRAARRLPPDNGHYSRGAAGCSPQPGRDQRALTPQLDRPTGRVPNADSHQLRKPKAKAIDYISIVIFYLYKILLLLQLFTL
jgi:hypothetical protein